MGELVLRTGVRLVWVLWAWVGAGFLFRLLVPPSGGEGGGGDRP